jgi:hypothetical protein
MTIPMPRNAKCPLCGHRSRDHIGTCLRKTARNSKGPEGETVHHLCGCAVWQGPRPWLGEGPAWGRA